MNKKTTASVVTAKYAVFFYARRSFDSSVYNYIRNSVRDSIWNFVDSSVDNYVRDSVDNFSINSIKELNKTYNSKRNE